MKAKTTKFLAVLAVLAMAFAGVAVLAQEQTNIADAAAEEGATVRAEGHNVSLTIVGGTTTYYTTAAKALKAVEAGKTATITLLASHSGAGLQSPAANQDVKVTIDFAGFTYTVNDPVGSEGTVNSGAQLLKGNEYTFKKGTLSVAAKTGETDGKCFVINNYAKLTLTDMVIDGTNLIERVKPVCVDPKVDSDNTVTIALWMQNGEVTIDGSTTVISGTAGDKNYGLAVNYWPQDGYYPDGAHVTLNTTGTINGILMALDSGTVTPAKISTLNITNAKIYGDVYTYKTMPVDKFTIKNATIPEGKTLINNGVIQLAEEGVLAVKGSYINNGKLTTSVTDATKIPVIEIAKSKEINMGFNSTVDKNVKFQYTDEYGDKHSFMTDNTLTVGMAGFKVYAMTNMIGVSGTVSLGASTTYTFQGNATLSGTVYTKTTGEGYDYKLTLGDSNVANADLKISKFQVADSGAVELASSALVTANSSFIMTGALSITGTAVLKVAEGATVKTEGTLTPGTGEVWNAGRVYASDYTGVTTSGKLFAIYMNSTTGKGTFFKGSEVFEYYGDDQPIRVVSDAYGAYLDMTGKSKVNLTSGAISVENKLYKYNTLILATYDTTIALTLAYNNQYPAEISLTGKNITNADIGDKYATYSGVKWDSPNNARITIVAPEEYTVVLVKSYNADKTIASTWTNSDLTVKTRDGTLTIPIDADGNVKLVYDVQYIITGAISANDYGFADVQKRFDDLKKVSQTEGTFTMIRNLATKTGTTVEDPAQIHVTMGKATEVTVKLADSKNKIAAGDVILSYTTDVNERSKDVVKPATGDAKFTIFSNQTVLLKYPAFEYFTFTTEFVAEAKGAFNVDEVELTKEQKAAGWKAAFEIKSDAGDSVKAGIGVTCDLDSLVQTFKLDTTNAAEKSTTVKVTFEEGKYYTGAGMHKAVEEITFAANAANPTLTVFKGEVFSISWLPVDDVWEDMEYIKTTPGEGDVVATYVEGTSVTAADQYTYTLKLDNIEYVKVKNSTETDVTLTDNKLSKDGVKIEAGEEDPKAIEQIDNNIVKLSITGSYIISWSYKLTIGGNTVTGTVSGAAASFNFANYTDSKITTAAAVTAMEITAINSEKIVYIVKTQPKDHMDFDGRTSTAGYFGDTMYIYANVDPLFKLEKVYVYKELKDGTPSTEYFEATKENGYFKYTMPSHNVVLVPDISANYAKVTFTNWDGEVLQSTDEKKGTMPEYKGATPVKPSVGTESYRFVGWDPAIAEVTQDVTYVAQFVPVEPSSENVTVAIGQTGADVNFIVFSNDQKAVGAGKISYVISYTYVNELGRQAVGHIDGEVSYDAAESQTFVKLTVTGLADALKDNYNGAFAVTGTYTFGDATGSLSKTVYNPVLEA